ncbi:transposase [Edaphosphingomonas haloaromaticamans]|nr:transposase [Sphingomonas haloaromaticamans]
MSLRRRRTIEEKRAMVEATYDPSTTVAEVAECFEVSPAQLYSWRR